MQDTVIEVSGLCKDYALYDQKIDRLREALDPLHKKRHHVFKALHDVNFSVHKGETVGIIGTNGSGKSTLLKILTGVVTPTSGTVTVNGKISALLELGAGFNPEYTGMQNIYLNGTIMGYTEDDMHQKVPGIIEFAGIGDFINQPVKTYSSGMFARLAFAVAISVEPDVLIVDEALSVGDVFFQSKCFKKFEQLQKLGTTILLVSHDLGSITQYCSRAILLNQGILITQGSPKEVVDVYKKILVNQYNPAEKTAVSVLQEQHTQIPSAVVWKTQMELNPELTEYGSRQAEIIDYAVLDESNSITNVLEKSTTCTLQMKVRFHETIRHPIFAIMIKDRKGNELTGTNTMVEKCDTGTPQAGTVMTVQFTQKMDLQGGFYLLSLGCTNFEKGELVVYHRLYDVCSIQVIAVKNSVGIYDMNSEIHVQTIESK